MRCTFCNSVMQERVADNEMVCMTCTICGYYMVFANQTNLANAVKTKRLRGLYKKPLDKRLVKFEADVLTAGNELQLTSETMSEFIDYWTETNTSGTKMRYELQKTWVSRRRLMTWAKRNFNHTEADNGTDEMVL